MIHSSLLYTSQLHAYCKHLCCWNDWRYNSFIWFKNSDRWKREGEGREALFPPEFHKQIFGFILELFLWMGWVTALACTEITARVTSKPVTQHRSHVCKPWGDNTPYTWKKGWRKDHQKAAVFLPPCTMHWEQSCILPFRGSAAPGHVPHPHVPYSTSALSASLRSQHPLASCPVDRLSVRLQNAEDGAYPWNKPTRWPHFQPSGLRMVWHKYCYTVLRKTVQQELKGSLHG